MKQYSGVTCASCHKEQSGTLNGEVFQCVYCESRNLVVISDTKRVFRIEPETSDTETLENVRRFLSEEKSVDTGFFNSLESNAHITLYYVPFYVSHGTAVVCFTVKKILDNKDAILMPGGKIMYSKIGKQKLLEVKSRVQFNDFGTCSCAVTDLDWGLYDLDLNGMPWIYLHNLKEIYSSARVLTPMISREKFEQVQHNPGVRSGDFHREIITQESNMVYLPVWRISTNHNGVVYDAFVNAATGDVLKASAPLSPDNRATSFSISFVISAFFSSILIVLGHYLYSFAVTRKDIFFPGMDVVVLLLILIVTVCICILAAVSGYGWDRVKHVYEIVKTQKKVFIHPLNKSADSWLNKLYDITLNLLTGQLEGMTHIDD